MDPELLKMLGEGAVALTANKRLARALREGYDLHMGDSGVACWQSPQVLTLGAWTGQLWEDSWSGRGVARGHIRRALWEEVIAADAEGEGLELLDVAATARKAVAALDLVHLYRMEPERFASLSEEAGAFTRWLGAYNLELDERGWLDEAALTGEVAALIGSGKIKPPDRVVFCGFDETTPSRDHLVRVLEESGCRVACAPWPAREGEAVLAEATDPEDEVMCAAAWLGGQTAQDPSKRLAVVAVNMELYAPLVERIFTLQLCPASTLPGAAESTPPFDLSFGARLSEEPVAAAALALIANSFSEVDTVKWRNLLLSPFWGGGPGQRWARAAWAARLMDRGAARYRLSQLRERAQGETGRDIPGASTAAQLLSELEAVTAGAGGSMEPSAWARLFMDLLDGAGWGREAALSSREYQGAEKFRETLSRLSGLDAVRARADFAWIFSRLRDLAGERFRPEGAQGAWPVMGMLEAGGLEYDGIWLLGAYDDALPARSAPNPFIPYAEMVRCGVREATPQGQLERSRRVLERLIASAGEVTVSFPTMIDGVDHGPSPLVAGLRASEPDAGRDFSPAAQVRDKAATGLARQLDRPPGLGPDDPVTGGVSLFSDQAACPFRAFVRHRLGLRRSDEPDDAMSAAEQGTGVHEALYYLHGVFPDNRSIAGADEATVDKAIAAAVDHGMGKLLAQRDVPLEQRVQRVERARIEQILRKWLETERARPDFEVLEREAVRTLVVGGLEATVRIDRLDRVGHGGALLLDYKTGDTPSPKRLYDERLTSPQLPIYALACDEATGVGYATLNRGKCEIKGVSKEGKDAAPKLTVDEHWEELKADWRAKLEELAGEFRTGHAATFPDDNTCRYCGLEPLCRVGDNEGEGEQ